MEARRVAGEGDGKERKGRGLPGSLAILKGSKPVEKNVPLGTCFALNGTEFFPAPEMLVDGLIAEGSINVLAGEKKHGKGWFALYVVDQVIEERTVVYLDRENGPRRTSQRIASMDVDSFAWLRHFNYLFGPNMSAVGEDVKNFEATLDRLEPSLVVFDSWAGFLSSANFEENDSSDIAEWASLYLQPLRERGVAALILDHVPYGHKRSRGSNRKGEEADAIFYLEKNEDFDRNTVGLVSVELQASRDGLPQRKTIFRAGGEDGRFVFERLEERKTYGLKGGRKPLAAFEVLLEFGEVGATNKVWKEACWEKRKIKESTFYDSLTKLKDHEFEGKKVLRQDGDRYHADAA